MYRGSFHWSKLQHYLIFTMRRTKQRSMTFFLPKLAPSNGQYDWRPPKILRGGGGGGVGTQKTWAPGHPTIIFFRFRRTNCVHKVNILGTFSEHTVPQRPVFGLAHELTEAPRFGKCSRPKRGAAGRQRTKNYRCTDCVLLGTFSEHIVCIKGRAGLDGTKNMAWRLRKMCRSHQARQINQVAVDLPSPWRKKASKKRNSAGVFGPRQARGRKERCAKRGEG